VRKHSFRAPLLKGKVKRQNTKARFTIVSSISITNVSLGFAGLTNPITLGVSRANGTNQLTLTGPTNYNYLVQSSSNLVDWIPAAIVPNTNGTALFSDPAATNSTKRFYRAVSP